MKPSDRVIQSKLKDHEVDVPDGLWEEIERRLPSKRKVPVWKKYVRYAAAASLLLALVAAFMVFFSASISYTFMAALHPFGLGAYVPAMLYFAGCILTLLTSVGHSRTMLFGVSAKVRK